MSLSHSQPFNPSTTLTHTRALGQTHIRYSYVPTEQRERNRIVKAMVATTVGKLGRKVEQYYCG